MANNSPSREVGHSRAFYSLIKVGGYPREILDKFQRYHRQSIPDDPIPGPFTERLLVLRSGGTLISSIPSNKYRDRDARCFHWEQVVWPRMDLSERFFW